MKQVLICALLLFTGSLSLANVCDSLPKAGHIAIPITLKDGTEVLFRAYLEVKEINSFKERAISHVYNNPRVFVGPHEVALTSYGLEAIAKSLGYDGLGYRDMSVNAGILRKRKTLTTAGNELVLAKSPKEHPVVSTMGVGIFYHAKCAPWMFN